MLCLFNLLLLEGWVPLEDSFELRSGLVEAEYLSDAVVLVGLVALTPSGVVHACVRVLPEHVVTEAVLHLVLVASDHLLASKLARVATDFVVLLDLPVLVRVVKDAFQAWEVPSVVVCIVLVDLVGPPASEVEHR